MIHLTAGIFGDSESAKKLGKQGTINDIGIYNHASSEGVFTYITVKSEKVQTLLQVINMIDVPVFFINQISPGLGEQIIAVNEFGFENGFIILENITEDQIMPLIKGTCLEKFSFVRNETELVENLKKIKISRPDTGLFVPIDNYFNVKSVGTVILGIIKSGSIKKYDKAVVQPLGKEVAIKGIQSQDKDMDSAEAGMRIGLNLKDIDAEEFKRGYVIGDAMKSKSLKLRFFKSKYSREQIKENDPVFVSSGLQVMTGTAKSIDPLEIEFENYITYLKDTKFLIATTKQIPLRILGHATL